MTEKRGVSSLSVCRMVKGIVTADLSRVSDIRFLAIVFGDTTGDFSGASFPWSPYVGRDQSCADGFYRRKGEKLEYLSQLRFRLSWTRGWNGMRTSSRRRTPPRGYQVPKGCPTWSQRRTMPQRSSSSMSRQRERRCEVLNPPIHPRTDAQAQFKVVAEHDQEWRKRSRARSWSSSESGRRKGSRRRRIRGLQWGRWRFLRRLRLHLLLLDQLHQQHLSPWLRQTCLSHQEALEAKEADGETADVVESGATGRLTKARETAVGPANNARVDAK